MKCLGTPSIATYFNPPDFDPIEKFVEYCDYFGFDVLHTLGSAWDMWVGNTTFDQGLLCKDENWDVKIDDQYKGEDELLRTVMIHTPGGILRHVEKHDRTSKYLIVSGTQEYLIKTHADFELLRRYAPEADRMDTSLISHARQATGDKGLVDANTYGTFNILGLFRKLEDVLTDPIQDPVFYQEMVDYFLPRLVLRAKKMLNAGADIIEVAGIGPARLARELFKNTFLKMRIAS